MPIKVLDNLKNKYAWGDVVFYGVLAAFLAVIFYYGVLAFKVYFYQKKIAELDDKIAAYSTPEEKAHEKRALEYKKKIDDFGAIMDSHKISSNIFAFLEKNTLPNVWFSNFSMAGTSNEIRVSGEAEDMETISRQFKVLETNKEYVKHISVLNSQQGSLGKVSFLLTIALEPKIFEYQ